MLRGWLHKALAAPNTLTRMVIYRRVSIKAWLGIFIVLSITTSIDLLVCMKFATRFLRKASTQTTASLSTVELSTQTSLGTVRPKLPSDRLGEQ